ncbi:antigen like protein [Clarias magur]|uniref:Antigen like protein n=1 Tax=Clarias magur TaxID=1594786 RepID=A0A8J4ULN2_CLAMG|nr:antigen like protein [Clarias magur]
MTFEASLRLAVQEVVRILPPVSEFSVSGPVGFTAVLPCELTSVDTHTLYIKWEIKVNTQSKIVFEREGEESYQDEGYEGRVDVPVEELRKGNCSLVLRNLRLTDTEIYTSYLTVTRHKRELSVTKETSRVHLTVSDRTEERPDKNSDSPDKAEERTDEKNSDSSGDTEKDPRYWWWILIVPGLVIPAGFVWWFLRRRKETISEYSY